MKRQEHPIAFRALSAFCALLLAATLTACDASGRLSFDGLWPGVTSGYVSPYDWDNLAQENGRFVYHEGGKQVSRTGIDVSSHQGAINWRSVAADGIDFAFIRLGYRGSSEGQVYLDQYFEDNYRGATEAGLPIGVYFFSQAINEAEAHEEAEFVLAALAGRALAYPVAYDFEPTGDGSGRANHLPRHQLTSDALAFCETIEAGGHRAMIYGNAGDISRYYLEVLKGRAIWFAEYDASYPSGQFDFSIWQYSNSGQVAGINTAVDMNIELDSH
ncbi:MAG: glycoside hydrolase [Coriobacteriales bacterium]|jgi:GH25 family lysozyme M1 (1,4-beta-N-acetylmuramidase)|nr:glycoside hydrolase [Coriobacteriales bacterium]